MTRILYVDDEEDIREVATMSLELDPDFSVKACSSGQQALEVARTWNPHLILLDVMMPGMDGPRTLSMLRAHPCTHHIPVLFFTAKVQAAETDKLRALGAEGVLAKPFDPMTLAAQVRAFLP